MTRTLTLAAILSCCAVSLRAQETYQAQDTLSPARDEQQDARDCIAALTWKPSSFQVRVSKSASLRFDRLVQFPSPKASGDARNDTVSIEWYQARDGDGRLLKRPAILVVHETGSNMAVGRLFAVSMRAMGWHAFMIHLPYYGERRAHKSSLPVAKMISAIPQAVADIRRARDAIAALPLVRRPLALQGISLGGFVAATAGSLDDGFDRVFIMLAGAGLYDILQNGKKDAAQIRKELAAVGLAGQKLKSVLDQIEPSRVAHRLRSDRTWLYSAKQDTIVPIANAKLLARAAKLGPQHHMVVLGNHYSCVVFLPGIISHMHEKMSPTKAESEANKAKVRKKTRDR